MTVWFTVQLDDRPGSLARVATALARARREHHRDRRRRRGHRRRPDADDLGRRGHARGFGALGLAFEEHDPTGGIEPDEMTVGDLRPGAAGRGSLG